MAKQSNAAKRGQVQESLPPYIKKRINEGSFILALSLALFMLLSLSSYNSADPGFFHFSEKTNKILNIGGYVGAYLADVLYFIFGQFAFFLPFALSFFAWLMLKTLRENQRLDNPAFLLRLSGFIFFMLSACSLLSFHALLAEEAPASLGGGLLGDFIAGGFDYAFSLRGSILLLFAIFLVGITWLTGLSWFKVTEFIGFYTLFIFDWGKIVFRRFFGDSSEVEVGNKKGNQTLRKSYTAGPRLGAAFDSLGENRESNEANDFSASLRPTFSLKNRSETKPESIKASASVSPTNTITAAGLPALALLDKAKQGKPLRGYTAQELETVSRDVEQHLLDFGIHAEVVAVHPGPVITRFELQLAAGIKVSKLSALAKDLARSLSVTSVRVVEVIPGKTVVGLELPNQNREVVRLSEVLSAEVYQKAHSTLSIALGVDIAGYPMIVDLAKMPHLLVAGTTGSGKSVGINAMILSLLFKANPNQIRLIMIDPKMLELSVYDGIPHLLTPVVTDMKEAASALRWCVVEMERRYRLMSALGVRNLAGFNTAIKEAQAKGEPLVDPLWKANQSTEPSPAVLEPLPYIVVIIDELADMMMVVGKKVEQLIARIAQKARAAGIHLILATQRPSVDVLTGLIKSNIPTRISFQVSSKIDSRTILDQQGAEQLLGHGDMLFLAPGTGAPLRVHGAFVDDKEVHRVADDWRSRGEPNYIEAITKISDSTDGFAGGEEQSTEDSDPLYDEAVEFVLQSRKASISAVQRRLKVGYNRAARLIEEMENKGIVGPLEGGYRDVLVNIGEEIS